MAQRVLITGASGFVGRALAAYLIGQGLDIHGISRSDKRRPKDWPGQWHVGDITDAEWVQSVLSTAQPDYLFHLAALTSSSSLTDLLRVNVIATQNVLQALVDLRAEARVVIAGSAAEYGLALPEELPIKEATTLRPLNPYGISKVAQGLLAFQYIHSHGLDIVRTRTFNLTGPGEPDTLVCSAFARQIVEIELGLRPPILSVGNLKSARDFLDVRDAVKAYWLLAKWGKRGEVYNVCCGKPMPIYEVLNMILNGIGVRVEVREDPKRQVTGDVSIQYGDPTKLRGATGWSPTILFKESLEDLVTEWRAYLSEVT